MGWEEVLVACMKTWGAGEGAGHGSRKSVAALADKLKSHGQIMIKITYILSMFCTENARKGV